MQPLRLALFSPLPPSTSGIAAYTAELVPRLRPKVAALDVFVDRPPRPDETGVWSVHDFIWKHRRRPYDLTVYQMGNASCHDYMWAYLFRYPGLVVLHDAQLHQARALYLTTRWPPRGEDYLIEFRANHPDAPADIRGLVSVRLGETLYHLWPFVRLVLQRARLTAVHNAWLMRDLAERHPDVDLAAIEMGVADPLVLEAGGESALDRAAAAFRARVGIPEGAVVVGAFGGVTPEKRIAQLVRALSAVRLRQPALHVLLAGAPVDYYDVMADVRRWGVADRVHVAGFVDDEELGAAMRAADICACLRWPTNYETSASWLRCLGAGRPTIITDLSHLADVPALDPRGWRPTSASGAEPVAVAIDILNEDHSLQLALDRLATDAALRHRLGTAARAWWEARHQLDDMVAAYERLIARAVSMNAKSPALPAHLLEDGTAEARALARETGVSLAGLLGPDS